MRTKLVFLSLSLSLGACKWTEFDDLQDQAWVKAITKPDGSKSNNWGVGIVRGKQASASGGVLAVFGNAQARLNEVTLAADGSAKFFDGEQDLGNLGIDALEIEPVVLADPSGDDFALITQGSAQQVIVAAGSNQNLIQFIVNGAAAVNAAGYMVAPKFDTDATVGAGRMAQPAQPLIASGDTVFGTFFMSPMSPFQQTSCKLSDGTNPINPLAMAGIRLTPANPTDDVAVWSSTGDMFVLDGHVFNGGHSGTPGGTLVCPGATAGAAAGILDTSLGILGTASPVGFTPGAGTISQILPFGDHFAILQAHTSSTAFLALWDFSAGTAGSGGAIVGSPLAEVGLTSVALFQAGGKTHVVAGYPSAVIDGIVSGKVDVYEVDTTTGIKSAPVETFSDAQPEDAEAFGRVVTVIQFNGKPIIVVAGNSEVFAFYRTPNLYNTETRQ